MFQLRMRILAGSLTVAIVPVCGGSTGSIRS
jgi:hypothetical protein